MEPLPELDVKARDRFYDFLKVLHFVQKHREKCIDPLSDEQQKKIPQPKEEHAYSSSQLPLGPMRNTHPYCAQDVLWQHSRPPQSRGVDKGGTIQLLLPWTSGFIKKIVEVIQPRQDGRVLGLGPLQPAKV